MGFFDKILSAAGKAKDVMEDVQKLGSQMERTASGVIGILEILMWQSVF